MVIEPLHSWLALVLSIIALSYNILSGRSKVASEKVAALTRRVDEAEARLTQIEADVKHLPSKDATHELQLAIVDLKGQVQILGERIKPVSAIADRVQEAIISRMEHS